MYFKHYFSGVVITVLTLGLASASLAEVFFEQDFESGDISTEPSPGWSWKSKPSPGDIDKAMMYGPNDVYYVTNEKSYAGNYSMRLDFAGRNQWCDACGYTEVVLSASDISSGCVAVSGAPFADVLFNKTNGFSKWSITSESSGQVCFNKNGALGDSIFGAASTSLNAGDEIKVPYKCGVNGIVGGNISRMSDCNKAISYFDNVSATDVGYGESISRRFHMYIPSETQMPNTTFKLAYSHWKVGDKNRSVKLKLSVQRGLQLELNAPNGETIVPNYYMPKDEWIYFEEVFTRETAEDAGDAEYHLYIGTTTIDYQEPVVSRAGFNIGSLVDMSMYGNWQHNVPVSGYVYVDELLISDAYSGPALKSNRPMAPGDVNIR